MKLDFAKTTFETSFGRLSQFNDNDEFVEVAFAGRSNVGKSSLLNKLMNRRSLAKVSSTPGKTATINFYKLRDDIRLVDLPGYGYAKVSKEEKKRWADLIGGYYALDRNLILTIILIDARHAPSKADMEMISFLAEMEMPSMLAFTKIDKLSKRELELRKKGFQEEIFEEFEIFSIYTSSEKGDGIQELRDTIEEVVTASLQDLEEEN